MLTTSVAAASIRADFASCASAARWSAERSSSVNCPFSSTLSPHLARPRNVARRACAPQWAWVAFGHCRRFHVRRSQMVRHRMNVQEPPCPDTSRVHVAALHPTLQPDTGQQRARRGRVAARTEVGRIASARAQRRARSAPTAAMIGEGAWRPSRRPCRPFLSGPRSWTQSSAFWPLTAPLTSPACRRQWAAVGSTSSQYVHSYSIFCTWMVRISGPYL